MAVSTTPVLLAEGLEFLESLSENAVQPSQAKNILIGLRLRHPDTEMRLIWQREKYDGSLQYNLLLKSESHGSVSLSYVPDGPVLPWPLRGVRRADEKVLLRVDDTDLEVGDAISYLDAMWDKIPVVRQLLGSCIVRQELDKNPVELGPEARQGAADAFRRSRKLFTKKATERWLKDRGLSYEGLEEIAAREAEVAILRQRMTGIEAAEILETDPAPFDSVRFSRLVFRDEHDAALAIGRINAGENFYSIAEESSYGGLLLSWDLLSSACCRDLPLAVSESIGRSNRGGDILGPVATDGGHSLVKVIEVIVADNSRSSLESVQRVLFQEWLDKKLECARIEWLWGNPDRTTGLGSPGMDSRWTDS